MKPFQDENRKYGGYFGLEWKKRNHLLSHLRNYKAAHRGKGRECCWKRRKEGRHGIWSKRMKILIA